VERGVTSRRTEPVLPAQEWAGWLGQRVRYRFGGTAPSRSYRTTPEHLGEVIEVPWSVTVRGTVIGATSRWDSSDQSARLLLVIAGWGEAPAEQCVIE